METSLVQSLKLALVQLTGLSKDTLHVYVGLTVLFVSAALTRRKLSSMLPLLAVLFVAFLGELADLRDDLTSLGYWRWSASIHDILNTVFWPAVLTVLARKTGLFRDQHKPK